MKKNTSPRVTSLPRLITAILILLVIALAIIFTISHLSKNDEPSSENLPSLSTLNYDGVAKALAEEDTQFSYITNIRFISTNPTNEAVAGSALTYWVEVIGLDENFEDKSIIDENVSVIEVNEKGEMKGIRQNTVFLLDTGKEHTTKLEIDYHGIKKAFTYDVIKQDITEENEAILINNYTGIGADYEPDNLKQSSKLVYTNTLVNFMQEDATKKLEEMFEAAEKDGIELWCCSGYRPYWMQTKLYDLACRNLGKDQTDTAHPGNSEHQTGYAMDITWSRAGGGLYESMENHKECEWLVENAHKYGFVLRFLKGCEDITGFIYEPWHYRYIGVENAKLFHEMQTPSRHVTLDEFLSVPRFK